MPREPIKKLRWDRVILALLLLAGIGAGVFYLVTK